MGWGELIGLLTGIIGTGISIYQWAVINESKKRKSELQYLLAGVCDVALQKRTAWENQINALPKPESPQDREMGRLYLRARDDFGEIVSLAVALEGVIDPDSSAISAGIDKSIAIVQKNNQLQTEGLKNPNKGAN